MKQFFLMQMPPNCETCSRVPLFIAVVVPRSGAALDTVDTIPASSPRTRGLHICPQEVVSRTGNDGHPRSLNITNSNRAFTLLKGPTSAFTFKKLLDTMLYK